MSTYLEQLNESQKAAVLQKNGPVIIIAGAGSGKTRVLTYKIAHLLQQGVDPFHILSLTFTNKAAREMKERIAQVVGNSEAKNLWMGTFHSTFARILRAEAPLLGYPQNFSIYDTQDSVRLISSLIKEMNLEKESYKPKQILSRISSYKNNLITVKAYFKNFELQEEDKLLCRPKTGEIYRQYVDRCFKSGAMDFDDLLLRTNELLARFPEILAKYQNRFRYIMVDEYQDTNHSQYLIVRTLADRFQNICVVGDDSQSIYSFRGANINNILNFQKDYPEAKIFKLEQNYRSTKNIVQAANSVINNNKIKLEKEVWTANETGESVKVIQLTSGEEEGNFVADSIFKNLNKHSLNPANFAVLYRTNAQSKTIEDALRKKNIKYKIYGGISFYQRKEIKDLLSYLRLLVNPNDEEALLRIINYPQRGIGTTTVDKLVLAANHYKKSVFEIIKSLDKIDIKLNQGTKNKLNDFLLMIQRLQIEVQTKNAFEIAELTIINTQFIKNLQKDGSIEGINKVENIQELLSGIKYFISDKSKTTNQITLTAFLEDVALATDFDNEKDREPGVSLMTVHLSKGLEFPFVYIIGLEENLFPSAMNINSRGELEEERRLFYVALTRAEKTVYLSYALSRYRWGKIVFSDTSRFIDEIDEKFKENVYSKLPEATDNKFVDASLFEKPSKIRFQEPTYKKLKKEQISKQKHNQPIYNKLKKISNSSSVIHTANQKLSVGNTVEHSRFGKGKVLTIEGEGSNKKAEIEFEKIGSKKLLLQYAKLKIKE
ncbi:MAG: ATP-dependent helicase [Tenacibaculum sp.]